MRIIFEGAETHTFETGPRAGETVFSAGTITQINWYDDDGNLLVRANDLSVDLASFAQMQAAGVGQIWEYVTSGGSIFNGSNDASTPDNDRSGDDIATGAGNDTVNGRGGSDYFKDAGGQDTYIGGAGWDELSYDDWFWNPSHALSGIVANMKTGNVTGPDGFVDTIRQIEGIRGTFLEDRFIGNRGDNSFMGLQGNDFINGGGGFDTVSYRNDARYGGEDGIRANLSTNRVRDGFGNTDRLRSVEGVEGSNYDDVIIDNGRNNWLRGRDGDDIFRVSGGDDYLQGEGGNDLFIFRTDTFGNDQIRDFEDRRDLIEIEGANRFNQLTILQDGSDALVQWNGNEIRLENFDSSNLSGADFVF